MSKIAMSPPGFDSVPCALLQPRKMVGVGDDLETVRVATVEFVQDELAGFGIGLREKTVRWI